MLEKSIYILMLKYIYKEDEKWLLLLLKQLKVVSHYLEI